MEQKRYKYSTRKGSSRDRGFMEACTDRNRDVREAMYCTEEEGEGIIGKWKVSRREKRPGLGKRILTYKHSQTTASIADYINFKRECDRKIRKQKRNYIITK